jgi:hypothetical protein
MAPDVAGDTVWTAPTKSRILRAVATTAPPGATKRKCTVIRDVCSLVVLAAVMPVVHVALARREDPRHTGPVSLSRSKPVQRG